MPVHQLQVGRRWILCRGEARGPATFLQLARLLREKVALFLGGMNRLAQATPRLLILATRRPISDKTLVRQIARQ